MSDYLSSLTADYTTTELSVKPHNTMTEAADRNQIVHEADDGSLSVVSLSDKVIFTTTLQWSVIEISEAETIMDFWADATKGDGRARTFYWQHPVDGNTYTVRFLEPLRRVYKSQIPNYREISQTKLRVEGVKP
jgi:hypothetical protein